jgi:diaminopimelate decarboxylase/aspartate kinase
VWRSYRAHRAQDWQTVNFPWVVLKFGGTSVSTAGNWHNIARILRARLQEGLRPVVVHSALSGMTDCLESLLAGAQQGEEYLVLLQQIEARHLQLARELGVVPGRELQAHLDDLRQIAAGVALVGEVSDRMRARVMAAGELMATVLGALFLRAQGFEVSWIDARTVLRTDSRRGAHARANALSATCSFTPDPELERRLHGPGHEQGNLVVLTQGFIAGDEDGNTVLLGRGGSDTSAAYLAAKLRAQRLEIWTDVPGMFSANPHMTPAARLLKTLHYDEAQEIASNGAKVLHPRCLLPVRQYDIPLHVFSTQMPDFPGTVITRTAGEGAAQVKAIAIKKGITLISMESPGMWHQVGFLADAFQVFKDHGLSVDLVSTSETNVTVSLDPGANALDAGIIEELVANLGRLCRVQVIGPCASLSLVGRNIRGILHKLGGALELFEEQKIYLVSQAANDLNFTFVIDEKQGDRLVHQLHDLLIRASSNDQVLGPTWEQLHTPAGQRPAARAASAWWEGRRGELLEIASTRSAAFVYDTATLSRRVADLRAMRSIDRVLYAMKANPHPQILRQVVTAGAGLECVSLGELERALAAGGTDVLFTPNFAPREEYVFAFEHGARVTLDNLHPLREWPEVFHGREVFVRIDTGHGRGHHEHVRTAGAYSKFGIPLPELEELGQLAAQHQVRIVGLHAHPGSGIFDIHSWVETFGQLSVLRERFPQVRTLNIGGGLAVPERPGELPVDLHALDEALAVARSPHPGVEVWMEPGRYIAAEMGVLLARVTQLKGKGTGVGTGPGVDKVRYVGVATGMNSLIRPALYGAHHEIVNLTRLGEPAHATFNIVGPICETGDQLGADRLLPITREGDILLIANAGAYGHAMSSHYNLRAPAEEIVL